jgi:hypothetical protein
MTIRLIAMGASILAFRSAIASESHYVRSTPAKPMVKPFMMLPGVVVLPDEGALYMMNPEGGIDAVKIASGKLLWTTKAAAEPLAASSGQLLAQGAPNRSRSLPLVFIDIDKGRGPAHAAGDHAQSQQSPSHHFLTQGRGDRGLRDNLVTLCSIKSKRGLSSSKTSSKGRRSFLRRFQDADNDSDHASAGGGYD